MKPSGQSGFALASVLTIMVVLSILGSMVYRNVGTDITHSGKDVKRVKAEFAAESSIQWALAELSRKRPDRLPYTMATHGPDGLTALKGSQTNADHLYTGDGSESGDPSIFVFDKSDLVVFPESQTGMDHDGWMYKTTSSQKSTVSGGNQETLAFKIWYPNDSTLRITGKGEVDGSSAELDLLSNLREVAVPF